MRNHGTGMTLFGFFETLKTRLVGGFTPSEKYESQLG
jgi:hypothetical protein